MTEDQLILSFMYSYFIDNADHTLLHYCGLCDAACPCRSQRVEAARTLATERVNELLAEYGEEIVDGKDAVKDDRYILYRMQFFFQFKFTFYNVDSFLPIIHVPFASMHVILD